MSLSDLFGIGAEGEGETPFDPANFSTALDAIMADRYPSADPPPVDPPPVDEVPPPPPVLPPPAQLPVDPPPPIAADAPPDFFSTLSDLERAELLAVRQALVDPERQGAIRRAYLGVPTDAPVAQAPPPPPPAPPALPEHVDPDSFEAQIWRELQESRAEITALRQGVTAQSAQTEAQLANAAARKVTAEFAGRYGDKLSAEEIQAVCSMAGAQRLPEAFLPTTGGDLEAAMGKSLEFVLRSNDALLAKILGAPVAPPSALPGHSPADAERQRKLTALSSAASPSGEVPVRKPIEHRPDGRLTEESRQAVLAQMVGKLTDSGEGN